MITITTETGSVYELHEGICTKRGYDSFKYGALMATPDWRPAYDEALKDDDYFDVHEWAAEHGEVRIPEAGEHLYVQGFENWHLSTRVTKVETN